MARRIILLALLFVCAFAIRAYQPVSRSELWLERAARWNEAIAAQNWEETYQSAHPGVTTMSVGGVSLRIDQVGSSWLFDWAVHPEATERGRNMTAGVVGLSFVIAALVTASVVVIERLADWGTALASGGLLTVAPFFLTQSRVFHVDALASMLAVLGALLILLYRQNRTLLPLAASGIVGGLALLTKAPTIFLFLFVGLVLLVDLLRAEERLQTLIRQLWPLFLQPLLIWMVLAVVIFVALWPSMWVAPADTLRNMLTDVTRYTTEPHPNPRFFLGETYADVVPPVIYYPVVMAFNLSVVSLTMGAFAALYYGVRRRDPSDLPMAPTTFWLLAAFCILFVLQMTIASKYSERYILPAFIMFEVLAGVGVAAFTRCVAGRFNTQRMHTAIVGAAVGLQAVITVSFFPDYGLHHNYLLGGNRTAARLVEFSEQAEGITPMVEYLNAQRNAASIRLGVAHPLGYELLPQYFAGQTEVYIERGQDYHLFQFVSLQRGYYAPGAKEALATYAETLREPVVIVRSDGVDISWMYEVAPPSGEPPIVVDRGWGGFVIVAWLWTIALIGAVVYIERTKPVSKPSTQPIDSAPA